MKLEFTMTIISRAICLPLTATIQYVFENVGWDLNVDINVLLCLLLCFLINKIYAEG